MSLQMYCMLCGIRVLSSGLYTTQNQFLYKLKKTNIAVLKEVDVSIQFKSYVYFCL